MHFSSRILVAISTTVHDLVFTVSTPLLSKTNDDLYVFPGQTNLLLKRCINPVQLYVFVRLGPYNMHPL